MKFNNNINKVLLITIVKEKYLNLKYMLNIYLTQQK